MRARGVLALACLLLGLVADWVSAAGQRSIAATARRRGLLSPNHCSPAGPAHPGLQAGKRTPEGFYYVNSGVKVGGRLCCLLCRSLCARRLPLLLQRPAPAPAAPRLARASPRLDPALTPAAPQLAIARGLAYAPYADLIWCETSTPDMEEAREFAGAWSCCLPPLCSLRLAGPVLARGCKVLPPQPAGACKAASACRPARRLPTGLLNEHVVSIRR